MKLQFHGKAGKSKQRRLACTCIWQCDPPAAAHVGSRHPTHIARIAWRCAVGVISCVSAIDHGIRSGRPQAGRSARRPPEQSGVPQNRRSCYNCAIDGQKLTPCRSAAVQAVPRPRTVAAAARRQQQAGKGFGKGAPTKADAPQQEQQPQQALAQQQQQQQQPAASTAVPPAPAAPQEGSASAAAQPAGQALPAVGRGRIFAVCAQVSVLVATLGFVLRQVAPAISPAVKDGQGEAVEVLLDCEWAAARYRGSECTDHTGSADSA